MEKFTSPGKTVRVHVPAMCCSVEAGTAKTLLDQCDGVARYEIDLMNRVITIETEQTHWDATALLTQLKRAGMAGFVEQREIPRMRLRIEQAQTQEQTDSILAVIGLDTQVDAQEHTFSFRATLEQTDLVVQRLRHSGWQPELLADTPSESPVSDTSVPRLRLGSALALAAAAEIAELSGAVPQWGIIVLAFAAIALAGVETFRVGLRSLLHARFNMNALMAVAVAGACALGAWPEAAMVMVLYEIGEAIEDLSMNKARSAIRGLLDLSPKVTQTRVDGRWVSVAIDKLTVGSVFRAAAGERIALDGLVIEGVGTVDEAAVTGESMPVDKQPDSPVWAGSLSLDSTLVIRATARAQDSMTARIIRAVETAEQKKAPLQRFVDRFAAYYTPAVFALALCTVLLGSALDPSQWTQWVYRALVILVISCPCALVISTPVTIVSAIALAARNGLLIKGGVFLEQGRLLRHVALDKTGTITRGEPRFEWVSVLSDLSEDRLWSLVGGLACMSSHPVSRALERAAALRGAAAAPVQEFKTLVGSGTQGRIEGALLHLCSLPWIAQRGLATEPVRAAFARAHAQGQTAVALADVFGVLAVFAVADTLRDEAAEAVATLHRAGLDTVLLTGDNARAAQAMAQRVGIEQVRSELLPEAKVQCVEQLLALAPTAMVGDGVNDAPALARASIGFAMGIKGTDAALDAADVALMDDDIAKVAWFKRLSELTHRTLITNIVFALSVKALFAVAAVLGYATMWMAVFADTGVCLIVVAYGMRLLNAQRQVDRLTAGPRPGA